MCLLGFSCSLSASQPCHFKPNRPQNFVAPWTNVQEHMWDIPLGFKCWRLDPQCNSIQRLWEPISCEVSHSTSRVTQCYVHSSMEHPEVRVNWRMQVTGVCLERVQFAPGLLPPLSLLPVCDILPLHDVPPHLGAMAMESSDLRPNALKPWAEINLCAPSFFELSFFLSGILLQLKAVMHRTLQPHSQSLNWSSWPNSDLDLSAFTP